MQTRFSLAVKYGHYQVIGVIYLTISMPWSLQWVKGLTMLFINSSSEKYKVFEISVTPPTFSVTSETLQCVGLLKLDCNFIDTHRSTLDERFDTEAVRVMVDLVEVDKIPRFIVPPPPVKSYEMALA
ncbi:hypothetical protein OUZ56_028636 [Daphnia magna]|uniref:Uncharacterized protein n=1 Tax=Daphnia magna TaxID=35525 RepID=A0ABR0B4G0_9CRUS|nr:hypothetical protein OUZ56_028636 [Daphnia magna]